MNRMATARMARDGMALVVLGVLACAREVTGPDSREPDPPDVAPPGFVVSSPVEQTAGVTVAFVSAIPGTVRWGDQVSVRNLASAGREAMADVREGGFDPVQLPAAAGDTLQFVMTDSLGKPTQTIQMVAARLPIRVVRVQPAARRTDVPLNARIEVVFSSPVVLTSAEAGVRLTRDGAVVSATVSAADPFSLVVLLEPDEPLAPSASYRVEVNKAVEGVNGLPLAETVVVEFQTASQSGTNSPPAAAFRAQCAGLRCLFDDLSADPDPGDSIVTRIWELGDGNAVQDLRSTTHTYAGTGGSFVVKLTVTDRQGATDSHSQTVTVWPTAVPIRSGTYERVSPHSTPGRHTRYVVNDDGTFEFHDETGTGRVVHRGHWSLCSCSSSPTLFRFDSIAAAHPEWNPEMGDVAAAGLASALAGSEIGVSYGGRMASEGFEEGVYSMDPVTVPMSPPPEVGQIAFVRDGRIYVVGTHGGIPAQLTTGPMDGDPAWSPDGSKIAFRRAGNSSPGIYVMDADGANLVLRTVAESDSGYRYSPTWTPDGQWVAFSCSPPGATIVEPAICKVRSAGPDTARVLVYAQGQGQLYDPSFSPDGRTIAYTSDWNAFDFSFDIWTVNSDGTAARALRAFTIPMGYEQYQSAFSPDGSRIAYIECPWAAVFCSSSAVAVMNADGSSSMRLVATRGFSSPTWSRDGQVIAFGSGSDIEWVSADGRQRGRIVTNGHSPAWRP